jgi:hypothetical protein
MLHLREEGWKEVKVARISTVELTDADPTRTHHSDRAGLWEASVYGLVNYLTYQGGMGIL